jgi:hypothetical protein
VFFLLIKRRELRRGVLEVSSLVKLRHCNAR